MMRHDALFSRYAIFDFAADADMMMPYAAMLRRATFFFFFFFFFFYAFFAITFSLRFSITDIFFRRRRR